MGGDNEDVEHLGNEDVISDKTDLCQERTAGDMSSQG